MVTMRGGYLASYVDSNNKPLAGIRMDIPMYLTGTFKLLSTYGYKLKQIHGEGTRRYIKYNETNLSLYLDVKTPDSDEWLKITLNQAKELQEVRDQTHMRRLFQSLDRGISSGASTTSSASSDAPVPHAFPIRIIGQSVESNMNGSLSSAVGRTSR